MEKIQSRAETLEERLIDFSILVVQIAEALSGTDFGKKMRDQLCRSAPSSALNYGESRAAESRKDFMHKMKVCLKELRETFVALKSVKKYLDYKKEHAQGLDAALKENNELISIFVKSIQTAGKRGGD